MTSQHRRESDPRIDEILENQQHHMRDFHANLQPGEATALIDEHRSMVPQIERILVILDGKIVTNASGETRRVGGLAVDVAQLKHDGSSRRGRDKIVTGLIASIPPFLLMLGAIVAAFIAASRGATL